jgi:hypothetical protein
VNCCVWFYEKNVSFTGEPKGIIFSFMEQCKFVKTNRDLFYFREIHIMYQLDVTVMCIDF